jgi:hypothetical protein
MDEITQKEGAPQKDAFFISDILKRAKANANTAELCNTVIRLASEIKFYTAIELTSVPEKKAKYILNRIEFLGEIIKKIIGLIHYTFSLEDTINKREDCIHVLSGEKQNLNIECQLLREHLNQAVDGYLLIASNNNIK